MICGPCGSADHVGPNPWDRFPTRGTFSILMRMLTKRGLYVNCKYATIVLTVFPHIVQRQLFFFGIVKS